LVHSSQVRWPTAQTPSINSVTCRAHTVCHAVTRQWALGTDWRGRAGTVCTLERDEHGHAVEYATDAHMHKTAQQHVACTLGARRIRRRGGRHVSRDGGGHRQSLRERDGQRNGQSDDGAQQRRRSSAIRRSTRLSAYGQRLHFSAGRTRGCTSRPVSDRSGGAQHVTPFDAHQGRSHRIATRRRRTLNLACTTRRARATVSRVHGCSGESGHCVSRGPW
jgi:hypothetical protein